MTDTSIYSPHLIRWIDSICLRCLLKTPPMSDGFHGSGQFQAVSEHHGIAPGVIKCRWKVADSFTILFPLKYLCVKWEHPLHPCFYLLSMWMFQYTHQNSHQNLAIDVFIPPSKFSHLGRLSQVVCRDAPVAKRLRVYLLPFGKSND